MEKAQIEQRICTYWTQRTKDFSTVRKNELNNSISARWLNEIEKFLPSEKPLKILDVGTGTGYFAILLSNAGHTVTGIDLTQSMLDEAKKTALEYGTAPTFLQMDAQQLLFPDNSFDAVISRNLTWTLPEPEKAYQQWLRAETLLQKLN